jgi:hypothetical protein
MCESFINIFERIVPDVSGLPLVDLKKSSHLDCPCCLSATAQVYPIGYKSCIYVF